MSRFAHVATDHLGPWRYVDGYWVRTDERRTRNAAFVRAASAALVALARTKGITVEEEETDT